MYTHNSFTLMERLDSSTAEQRATDDNQDGYFCGFFFKGSTYSLFPRVRNKTIHFLSHETNILYKNSSSLLSDYRTVLYGTWYSILYSTCRNLKRGVLTFKSPLDEKQPCFLLRGQHLVFIKFLMLILFYWGTSRWKMVTIDNIHRLLSIPYLKKYSLFVCVVHLLRLRCFREICKKYFYLRCKFPNNYC